MKYLILLFLVSCASPEYIGIEDAFNSANNLGCIELKDVELGTLKADYVLCNYDEFFKVKDARDQLQINADYYKEEMEKCVEMMNDWRIK